MTPSRPAVILVGAPGSGKGTQAARLADLLGAERLEVGRLFREIAEVDSPLGRRIGELMVVGDLVPDDLTNEVVAERLAALPADQGFVMDGYPRNAAQAEALRGLLAGLGRLDPRPVAVRLDVPRDELRERLRRRRDLEGRHDDTDEAIARRLELYDAQTLPSLGTMADWADVVAVNADQPVEGVTGELVEKLNL